MHSSKINLPTTDALVSTVLVVRDAEHAIEPLVLSLQSILRSVSGDYEIVVVDNASRDQTVEKLEELVARLPNVQVFCLSAQVGDDVARLAGLEQAIGDYVILLDLDDDIHQIPTLLEHAVMGNELVLATRTDARDRHAPGLHGVCSRAFLWLFRALSSYDLREDAPRFRLMSRRVVNYILQHENAYLMYQLLPLTGGFRAVRLTYSVPDHDPVPVKRTFREAANHGIALLISTSTVPLRLITLTCGIAASISLLYSVYVFLVFLIKEHVAEGWTTLSLQLSIQFFLLAFAIGMLAEYILQIQRQSAGRPRYYVAREFRSEQITRELKLNVREDVPADRRAPLP